MKLIVITKTNTRQRVRVVLPERAALVENDQEAQAYPYWPNDGEEKYVFPWNGTETAGHAQYNQDGSRF
jgi:hypothetical protein